MASTIHVPKLTKLSAHLLIKHLHIKGIFNKEIYGNSVDPTFTLEQIWYLGDIQLGRNALTPQGSYNYSRITTLNVLKTKPFNKDLTLLRQVPIFAICPIQLLRIIRDKLVILQVEGYVEAHITNGPWPISHPTAYSYRLRPLVRAYNNDHDLKLLFSNL